MSTIRKQALTGSLVIYIGFLIGALNTYLFVHQGLFTTEQYGLTRIFTDFGELMASIGSLGTAAVIIKFYPFYRSNLRHKDIDLITWCFAIALIGSILVIFGGWIFKDYFIEKFKNSPLLIPYYKWLFPFALGFLFFKVVENFCFIIYKSVLSNIFKEIGFRIYTLILITIFYFKLVSFEGMIYFFSFAYPILFISLFTYLFGTNQLNLSFKISRVTKKFYKKMFNLQALYFTGQIILTLGGVIDTLMLTAMLPNGLALAGVYTFSAFGASIMDAPRRSLTAVSIGTLSQAWKDKNMPEINRIYSRSCINMMLFAIIIFGLIILNIQNAIDVLKINADYKMAVALVIILGISRIIDAGTGVNAQIIGTSNFWRFDFFTGVIMLAVRLPLVFFFIKAYGLIGPAFAELISLAIYNIIRTEFLRRKFNMQPFTVKTVYALLLSATAFFSSYFLFINFDGWAAIILKTITFLLIMISGIFYLKLSPDALQLYDKFILKRFRKS